jgi:DNA polymerase-3 subunit delta'
MSDDFDREDDVAGGDAEFVAPPIEFLPWQDAARDKLGGALRQGRLMHGLLVHGPAGVGKEQFAAALAAALLCTARGERFAACGHCADCQLSRAGNHPDLHWVRPLADKEGKLRKSIGVDQVREVCDALGMTSLRSGHRIALVAPAEKMTPPAQNAFLKTLEEPAPRTLLVLVTARPSQLLPTLRSRCQRVEVASPPPEQALRWLQQQLGSPAPPSLLELAGGAPFKALALAPYFAELERQMTAVLGDYMSGRIEVSRAAAEMQGEGLAARLDWLERWLGGALREAACIGDENPLTFRGQPALQRRAGAVNITAAFEVMDRLREARRLLEGSASPPLVVENLLLALRAAWRPRQGA